MDIENNKLVRTESKMDLNDTIENIEVIEPKKKKKATNNKYEARQTIQRTRKLWNGSHDTKLRNANNKKRDLDLK